jgi:hypothetical protein
MSLPTSNRTFAGYAPPANQRCENGIASSRSRCEEIGHQLRLVDHDLPRMEPEEEVGIAGHEIPVAATLQVKPAPIGGQ